MKKKGVCVTFMRYNADMFARARIDTFHINSRDAERLLLVQRF